MKWFKHMSDASEDAFIENIEEVFGWEGYGRWWKLLEIIAKKMDESNNCYAEHSWVKWQSLLKGKRNKLETFLVHCQDKGKINLEQNGNILKIICPKLLEIRDNHTKNLQVTYEDDCKLLAPKNKDKRLKIEREEAHTQNFKDLIFEEEMKLIGTNEGLTEDATRNSWNKFKIHFDSKPPDDWLKSWKKWVKDERNRGVIPLPPKQQSKEQWTAEELQIQTVGIAKWQQKSGMFVNAENMRELQKWEAEKGAVTWRHLKDWREQQAKLEENNISQKELAIHK